MNDRFWYLVASNWSTVIDPDEIDKQNKFIEKLPKDLGSVDKRLISDDIDDVDDI